MSTNHVADIHILQIKSVTDLNDKSMCIRGYTYTHRKARLVEAFQQAAQGKDTVLLGSVKQPGILKPKPFTGCAV